MIINTANLASLFTGFKAAFNTGFRGITPQWSDLATLVPSSAAAEDYAWLGQFPRLREWVGDRHIKNMTAGKYTVRNKPFESTVGVLREDIERDQYGVYSPLFQEMGHAAATHPDELVFGLLARGNAELCYDGQYFFDTDHPVGSGTVSNWGGGSGTAWYLLDTSRPLKPLIFQRERDYNLVTMTREDDEAVFMRREYRYGVDARCNVGFGFWQMAWGSKQTLDEAAYGAARAAMMALKSDEGRPLGIRPTVLVVPPALETTALKVLEAESLANGATNVLRNTAKVMVAPWLA